MTRNTRSKPFSEINVTPFVDVMLVLLIIFMVTAPLLTVGVQVDLPETNADTLQSDNEPLEVTIDASGNIFIQETEIGISELVPKMKAITAGIAANKPRAVANNASAIPGATTAREVFLEMAID